MARDAPKISHYASRRSNIMNIKVVEYNSKTNIKVRTSKKGGKNA